MKASIALAILIVALGTGIGWRDQRKLSLAWELHEKLTSRTSSSHSAGGGPAPSSSKHRERRKPEVRAKFVNFVEQENRVNSSRLLHHLDDLAR